MFFLVDLACLSLFFFFFFNDTATTEIYTLSLHDALPICYFSPLNARLNSWAPSLAAPPTAWPAFFASWPTSLPARPRSEEHTSELQSRLHLVCRLLLEKKKKNTATAY